MERNVIKLFSFHAWLILSPAALVIKCIAENLQAVKSNDQAIRIIKQLLSIMLIELKHQGLTAEKSALQKLYQGERANVLNIIRS